jgi:hypothetical protein
MGERGGSPGDDQRLSRIAPSILTKYCLIILINNLEIAYYCLYKQNIVTMSICFTRMPSRISVAFSSERKCPSY